MDLTLPLEYAAIEKILPHRYPFLLVDRITELEMDKRIVGLKNISSNEPYLMRSPSGQMVLPPTILTEVIAQVGAILILSKPENRESSAMVTLPVSVGRSVKSGLVPENGSRLRPSCVWTFWTGPLESTTAPATSVMSSM